MAMAFTTADGDRHYNGDRQVAFAICNIKRYCHVEYQLILRRKLLTLCLCCARHWHAATQFRVDDSLVDGDSEVDGDGEVDSDGESKCNGDF